MRGDLPDALAARSGLEAGRRTPAGRMKRSRPAWRRCAALAAREPRHGLVHHFVTPDFGPAPCSGDRTMPAPRWPDGDLPSETGCGAVLHGSGLQPRGRRRRRSWCSRCLDRPDVTSSTSASQLSQRAGQPAPDPARTRGSGRGVVERGERGRPEVALLIHPRRRAQPHDPRRAPPDKAQKIFSGFSRIAPPAGARQPVYRFASAGHAKCFMPVTPRPDSSYHEPAAGPFSPDFPFLNTRLNRGRFASPGVFF